jgi:hypothetical protein
MRRRETDAFKEKGSKAIHVMSEHPGPSTRLPDVYFAVTGKHSGRFATYEEADKTWCDRVEDLFQRANGEGTDNRRLAAEEIEGRADLLERMAAGKFTNAAQVRQR